MKMDNSRDFLLLEEYQSDDEETLAAEKIQLALKTRTRPVLDRFHDSSKVNALCYILEQC